MSDNPFKLQINFTKAYKDEDGNAFLEGTAVKRLERIRSERYRLGRVERPK